MGVRATALALAAICAAPVMAHAADMPKVAPLDVAIENSTHDWTGPYVGVNAGYSLGEFGTFTPAGSDTYKGNGAIGGFQIGYNKQLGAAVIGIEGDIQAAGIDGSGDAPAGAGTDASLDWFSTVRGRVGYAFDRTLIYGTAGVVAGRLSADVPGAGSDDQTAWGLAAGAGIERSLTENLTLKAEYLYLDLKEKELDTGPTDQNTEWDGHVMRFGANLKF